MINGQQVTRPGNQNGYGKRRDGPIDLAPELVKIMSFEKVLEFCQELTVATNGQELGQYTLVSGGSRDTPPEG